MAELKYKFNFQEDVEFLRVKDASILKTKLMIFDRLKAIQVCSAWKDEKYYKGDIQAWNQFGDHSFVDFIGNAFGVPSFDFMNMERIVGLKDIDGRKLLMEAGYSNAITYVNLSSEKKKPVLNEFRKSSGRTMRQIENEKFPEKKTKKKSKTFPIIDKTISKREYDKVIKENAELKKEVQDLKEKIENLKAFIADYAEKPKVLKQA